MIGTKYKNQIMYLYYEMPNLIAAFGVAQPHSCIGGVAFV